MTRPGMRDADRLPPGLRLPASPRALDYALALAAGLAAVAALLSIPALLGTGALWATASGDIARTLTGHLAFQADPWRWPLLTTRMLLWPDTASVAMADSNPAASLLAKMISRSLGVPPLNLLGAWLGLCVLLQPVAAVYALRGVVRDRPEASLAAASLSLLSMAWLFRIVHPNLWGHFIILMALGLALRMMAGGVRRGWAKASGVLTAAMLFHPYLFVMCAAVLAAPAVDATLRRRAALRSWASLLLAYAVPLMVFRTLNGEFVGGSAGFGFGFFSMNLLSPVWPWFSGLFSADLESFDATGGQAEGYNYLGAGVLLLLAAAVLLMVAARWLPHLFRPRHPTTRLPLGLLPCLAGLLALALSSRVYAGHQLLLDLGPGPWDKVFAPVRASGRFFWPVGYVLLIGGVAAITARLPRPVSAAVLGIAVLLQTADAVPLWHRTADMLAGPRNPPPTLALPAGTALVRVVPPIPCTTNQVIIEQATALMLQGARRGIRLDGAGLARAPRGFGCDKASLNAIELPLEPGEERVFLDPAASAHIRTAWLGAGARCGVSDGITVCSNGVPPPTGNAIPASGDMPEIGATSPGLAGAALRPLLASGWVPGTGEPPEAHGRPCHPAVPTGPPAAGRRRARHLAHPAHRTRPGTQATDHPGARRCGRRRLGHGARRRNGVGFRGVHRAGRGVGRVPHRPGWIA